MKRSAEDMETTVIITDIACFGNEFFVTHFIGSVNAEELAILIKLNGKTVMSEDKEADNGFLHFIDDAEGQTRFKIVESKDLHKHVVPHFVFTQGEE